LPVNSVIFSQNSFSLTPEIFNAVDVIFAIYKLLRVVYSLMNKSAGVKDVVRFVTVGVNCDIIKHFQCVMEK